MGRCALDCAAALHCAGVGGGAAAVLPAIDDAIQAGLVEEVQPDRYRFIHALVRMALHDELGLGERRRLHGAVGRALEAVHRHDVAPVLPDLARHFHLAAQGAEVATAIDYAVRVGVQADASRAFEDAAGFFQHAFDLMQQREAADPGDEAAVLLHLGEARRKAGGLGPALAAFRSAAALAQRHGLAGLPADAAIGCEACAWSAGALHLDAAQGLLEQALERHFAEAIAMNERTGAIAPLAHTRRDCAAMQRARGRPGDHERAAQLLKQARNSAAALPGRHLRWASQPILKPGLSAHLLRDIGLTERAPDSPAWRDEQYIWR